MRKIIILLLIYLPAYPFDWSKLLKSEFRSPSEDCLSFLEACSSQRGKQVYLNSMAYESATLKYSIEDNFNKVLQIMGIKKNETISFPEVVFAKEAKLQEFQNDVFPQWGMKPDFITNVYVAHKNRIYLLDEKRYYEQNGRCMDDSLAHELVHYIQVKYQNIPIEYFDDSMEFEAIDIQSRFRDLFCKLN